jgi:dTDP-4-dehydrorhamnose reductase
MKVLVIGGTGMLGHKLVQRWMNRFELWTTIKGRFEDYGKYGIFDRQKTFDSVDAENFQTVAKAVEEINPQVIFNAVGVIKQLPTSENVVKTLTINSLFPHRLAEITENCGAKLINISTDCVFNGQKGNYTEEDISNATDVYGKSKNLGEVTKGNCLTLRTSIIGRELQTAHGLVEWFLSNRGKKVKGFVNAIYSGFPTIVLADIIADLIENHHNLSGLYHLSADSINKYDLLKLINEAYRTEIEIEPFEDFRIDRSLNSAKFREATGFKPEGWRKMIKKMADDPTPYDEWRK